MPPVIETRSLSFSYGREGREIDSLTLTVPQGAIYGFLGANGAGKTTTIRLILGLLFPAGGEIRLFGQSLSDQRPAIMARLGALVEDAALYPNLSAEENLRVFARYRGLPARHISRALHQVGLSDKAHKTVRTFSTGMKQRLGVALALLPDPELIILDEPGNGLDPKGMIELRQLLLRLSRDQGKTILISSHILSEIDRICSHVGIIAKGRLRFEGPISDLRRHNPNRMELELQTDDQAKTEKILQQAGYSVISRPDGSLTVSLENRPAIGALIDLLRRQSINIEYLSPQDSLEQLFISLTEKEA